MKRFFALTIMAIMSLTLATSLHAQKELPAAPKNLQGELTVLESLPEQYRAALSWEYDIKLPDDPHQLDAYVFMIYMAKGKTTDLSKFYEAAILPLMEVMKYNDMAGKFVYSYPITKKGEYSFFVTMMKFDPNSDKQPLESEPSNIVHINAQDITEYPEITFDNELYFYEFEVGEEAKIEFHASSEADCPIEYDLAHKDLPDNHSFDKSSGLLTFTANQAGHYFVEVKASLSCLPGINAYAYAEIMVSEQTCAVITGKIITDKDYNFEKSFVAAHKIFANDEYGFVENYTYLGHVDPESGEFVIEVPEGKFALEAYGYGLNNEKNWYDGKTNFVESDKISLQCDETVDVTFHMEVLPEPEMITIKGRLVSKASDEFITGIVSFMPAKNIFDEREDFPYDIFMKEIVVETDEFGQFTVALYNNIEYIAMVVPFSPDFEPQFYDATLDIMEAKRFYAKDFAEEELIFTPFRPQHHENAIAGSVTNNLGEPVESKVVALMVRQEDNVNFQYSKSSFTRHDGTYSITNLEPGDYIVLSAPASKRYTSGYFVDANTMTTNWKEAGEVKVQANASARDINFIHSSQTDKPEGFAEIRGTVYNADEKVEEKRNRDNTMKSAETLAGVILHLKNSNGILIAQTMTDNKGEFTFSSVPAGEFTLTADKAGYKTATLNVRTDYFTDYNVEYTFVMEKESKESPTSVDNSNGRQNQVSIFPTPASDKISISGGNLNGDYVVRIYNSLGELVSQSSGNALPAANINLGISHLSSGSYYLSISSGEHTYQSNFTIIR